MRACWGYSREQDVENPIPARADPRPVYAECAQILERRRRERDIRRLGCTGSVGQRA